MKSAAATPQEYLNELPEDRKTAMTGLRDTILKNLSEGFEETMSYGMIGYVVSRSAYPAGYHCDPKIRLPFINIASQKNFIALHHLGLYASKELLDWFVSEYPKHSKTKLDMGKGCVRFKKPDTIPLGLVGELVSKMSSQQWIAIYEENIKK